MMVDKKDIIKDIRFCKDLKSREIMIQVPYDAIKKVVRETYKR